GRERRFPGMMTAKESLASVKQFWFLDRESGPEERECLQLDCKDAPGALVIFTSEAAAESYRSVAPSYGGELKHDWELSFMRRSDVPTFLNDIGGVSSHVVVDPGPAEEPGLVLTIFEFLMEL